MAGAAKHQTSNVGDTTDITSQSMTSVPLPLPGSTYASEAPSITPDSHNTIVLVAQ
jgi:hypothetical protein